MKQERNEHVNYETQKASLKKLAIGAVMLASAGIAIAIYEGPPKVDTTGKPKTVAEDQAGRFLLRP